MTSHCPGIDTIVVCVAESGREVGEHLFSLLARKGEGMPSIWWAGAESSDVYTVDIILHQELDQRAIDLNYMHATKGSGQGEDRLKVWQKTGVFHKDSSRAACDFMPSMLKVAGLESEQAAMLGELSDDSDTIQRLSRTEHLRWNAFHFCQGYTTMPLEKFETPVGRTGRQRRVQDVFAMQHACLVSWEELNTLDEIEGNPVGTQQAKDIANVRALARMF